MHGSYARSALVEISEDDVRAMLALDETLYVEHKKDLAKDPRDASKQLSKVVSAFANTSGGWLLVGVTAGEPNGSEEQWATGKVTLVDAVRDRLRDRVDPLPTFEARKFVLDGGPVGVVRVYASTDTPHVDTRTGSVFVREPAGDRDTQPPPSGDAQRKSDRARFATRQISNRAELVELSRRGERAAERVDQLLAPDRQLPLVTYALGLGFDRVTEHRYALRHRDVATIAVRLVPYSLSPRFRGWSTTADAVEAARLGLEYLTGTRGLGPGFVHPDMAGVRGLFSVRHHGPHVSSLGEQLGAMAKTVIDGAGVVGVAIDLAAVEQPAQRRRLSLTELADVLLGPLRAAAEMLRVSEHPGRVRCQVDVCRLDLALHLDGAAFNQPHAPTATDLILPDDDDATLRAVAHLATNVYARGAGIHAWDPL